jgi:hypothetical protein
MPTLTVTKSYDDTTVLTEAQLDSIKSSIETWANTTKLDADNIQTGGIATSNYGTASVDATALASNAVTTAKIIDGAVTQAKRAALGHQLSSSSGTFTTTSASLVDVTNLSVTITTTGRPIMISLVGTTTLSYIGVTRTGQSTQGNMMLVRDSTNISGSLIYRQNVGASTSTGDITPSSFMHIDAVAAGTYTYKMQASAVSGTTTSFTQIKLIAYEL